MKLADQYNRVNLYAACIALLFTAIAYYMAISYILTRQIDKGLKVEEQEIQHFIEKNGRLPEPSTYKDQKIEFSDISSPEERVFRNKKVWNSREHVYDPWRELSTTLKNGPRLYSASIMVSKVESEDLVRIILLITVLISSLTLLILFAFNRLLLRNLWQPFHTTLQELRKFEINDPSDLKLTDSRIEEFSELNRAVSGMSTRVKQEFEDLKAFTENASHELMTPLAIIRSKLDSLIQSESLTRDQSLLSSDIYEAVTRMTRINQSLLLLIKIDNKLMPDVQEMDLEVLMNQKIRQFKELISKRKIRLEEKIDVCKLSMSPYLADVLLSNLFSNAINHNYEGGFISVSLDKKRLRFSNSGPKEALNSDQIFDRFQKGSNSEGTGLGLTLVRQICLNSGFGLYYQFENFEHIFLIQFLDTQVEKPSDFHQDRIADLF